MARVAALKPDIIKIRVDDNLGTATKMTPDVYRAVIDEAHKRGLRVAAHIFYLDDAKDLLKAGVDLIAHSVRDKELDDETIALMKARFVPYCPTLTREISTFVYESTPAFFADPFFLKEADRDDLGDGAPPGIEAPGEDLFCLRIDAAWRCGAALHGGAGRTLVRSAPGGVVVFALVIEKPDGSREEQRIPAATYRKLIAATNMKQRVRKLFEYTWADRLGYAVVGTPNLLEYDQGFFVKGGDGLADVKPIAGLYKQQVFALAQWLGLPDGVASRTLRMNSSR